MSVSSVNSGGNANAKVSQQPSQNRLAVEAQKMKQPEPAKAKVETAPPRKAEEPKPVVNAQGQTTGQRINVTA